MSFKFEMSLEGSINGFDFTLDGFGTRDPVGGIVEGRYRSNFQSGSVQEAMGCFNHQLFNSLIITGYPSESASRGAAENPFKGRPYTYRRKVSFGSRGALLLETGVSFGVDGLLRSTFQVDGSVDLPPLVDVEPTIETWVPLDDKKVSGVFVMPWITEDGSHVHGVAETEYTLLGDGPGLTRSQHRWIKIRATGNLESFERHQLSILLNPEVTPG